MTQEQPVRDPQKSLPVIFRAMLLGQILLFGIALFLSVSKNFPPSLQHLDKPLQVTVVLLSFLCIYLGITLFKKKLQTLPEATDETAKWKIITSAHLIRWALIEGPVLFCIICYLLVGNLSFAALAGTLIIFFGLQAPIVQSTK